MRGAGAAIAGVMLLAACGPRPDAPAKDEAAAEPAAEASGPSFDCARAASPFEKDVCADETLSGLDRRMAAAYAKAQAAIPAAFAEDLRRTQRGWLKAASLACQPRDLPEGAAGETRTSCLHRFYEERIETLDHSLEEFGGRRFVSLTAYPYREAGPEEDGPRTIEITFQMNQLAEPRSRAEQRWNDMISQRAGETYAASDIYYRGDIWVVLGAVSPDLIAASISEVHARGPGGVSGRTEHILWSLDQSRTIEAADLFTTSLKSMAPLARTTWLAENGGDDPPPLEDFELLAQTARYWSVTPQGVLFQPDDDNALGGAHYAANLGVVIPWAKASPYLRSDLPFDPQTLKD